MRRVVLLLGIGCLAVVCYVGTWRAFRPPIQLLLPPDATNVHVVDNSWGEWILTYRAPGPGYAWYVMVAYQQEANGWMQSGEQYTGGPLFPATYTRITLFGFVALWEHVELDGDLHGAQIRMRRWIVIQPLKLVSALASNLLFDGCVASTRRFGGCVKRDRPTWRSLCTCSTSGRSWQLLSR